MKRLLSLVLAGFMIMAFGVPAMASGAAIGPVVVQLVAGSWDGDEYDDWVFMSDGTFYLCGSGSVPVGYDAWNNYYDTDGDGNGDAMPLYHTKKLVIGDGMTSVDGFGGAMQLSEIVWGNNVQTISKEAFVGTAITSLELPDSVITIGEKAFYNCKNLTSVVLSDSVVTIGAYAFRGCINLENFVFGKNVETIGTWVFGDGYGDGSGANKIKSIELPDSVKSIGDKAFYYSKNLESIKLSANLESIGESAFEGCTLLREVEIPEKVTRIGKKAFHMCWRLEKANIPDSVTWTGTAVFDGCTSLKSCPLGKNLPELTDYFFYRCHRLEDVVIPDSVTSIGQDAFYQCYSIESLVIPDSVETVNISAMDECLGMHTLVVGKNVTSNMRCDGVRLKNVYFGFDASTFSERGFIKNNFTGNLVFGIDTEAFKRVKVLYTYDGKVLETRDIFGYPGDKVTVEGTAEYVDGNAYYYADTALTIPEDSDTLELGMYKVDIVSENLIENGDFSDGLTGWKNCAGSDASETYFQLNGDGTIQASGNYGQTGVGSLHRVWETEKGKKYLFAYTSNSNNVYHKTSVKSTAIDTLDGTIISDGSEYEQNAVIFTADEFMQINFRWLAGSNVIGNFELYEIEIPNEKTVEIKYNVDGNTVNTAYKVYNTLVSDGAEFLEYIYAQNGVNNIYKKESFVAKDSAVIEMDAVENPGNYNVGDIVTLSGADYMVETNNLVPNGDFSMGLTGWYTGAGTKATSEAFILQNDGTVKMTYGGADSINSLYRAWKTEKGKKYMFTFTTDTANTFHRVSAKSDLSSAADGTVIFGASTVGENIVVFDATEEYLQINFRWSTNNKVGNFNLYEISEIEYINVTAGSIPVIIGENQVANKTEAVVKGSKITLVSDGLLVKADGKYYPVNEAFTITENMDFTNGYVIAATGLSIEMGAQVRIGTTPIEQGAQLDAQRDSGLRFVGTANYSDTLIADDAAEFGMKIQAEGSDSVKYIKAEKFQDEDNSVFTVAITNLKTGNYNRKYTATGYAKITMFDGTVKEFTSDSITRSIYQVSVGLMKTQGEINSALKNILNAYINQVGIRLLYRSDGSMCVNDSNSGKYSGEVYFDVEYVVNEDNSTTVTITPFGLQEAFNNSVDIASWWKEYVRVNNNNSTVKTYISNEKLENGVLTFDFKVK